MPSIPLSGVISRLPPRRLLELPIEDTVMSTTWPGLANAGRSACTDTAATFFNCTLPDPGGTLMPNCESMLLKVCRVNGVWVVWSPVPLSPTTRP
ncbi:hypothetical protein D3C79_739340 [compost metagenome]